MPDFVIAKIRWEGIWPAVPKDDRAHGKAQSASQQKGHGSRAKLVVDGADQKDNEPAHQQKADIGQQHRNLCKEDGFEGNEEDRQTPDDAEQHPARSPAKDGKAERRVRARNEDVNGVMVENAKDTQIFIEE